MYPAFVTNTGSYIKNVVRNFVVKQMDQKIKKVRKSKSVCYHQMINQVNDLEKLISKQDIYL